MPQVMGVLYTATEFSNYVSAFTEGDIRVERVAFLDYDGLSDSSKV